MSDDKTKALYSAFIAKDARFDGRFFIGISSTGIYCRPICRAKQPKIENCTFYRTAAEAEQAGYRPCLLCRPELAPGTATVDATASLASRAARLLEETCGNGQSIDKLAGRLGYTDRHLRRAFSAEYNVSPIQYVQTCRLLLAKSLLTDTDLSILDVAMTAGFGSLRRFNDLFKKQYRLSPSSLRRQTTAANNSVDGVTISLGYRPPYRWTRILDFLARRTIPGVELVTNNEYLRTVSFVYEDKKKGEIILRGWVRIGKHPDKNALSVTVAQELLPVLPQVLARIKNLFDLHCDPDAISEGLSCMNDIQSGLYVPGTRLPGCFDPYEMTVRAILGQQITVKAARTLAARMVGAYGKPLKTGIVGLTHTFPTPDEITMLEGSLSNHLGPLGITSARANTIHELSKAFVQNDINFGINAYPENEIKKLMGIHGIGKWTAGYIAMRTMGWTDAFLETDAGIKKTLSQYTEKEMLKLAGEWRPWRSYATINLWSYETSPKART